MSTDVYDKADDPAKQAAAQNDVGPFNLITSRGFEQWLAESKVTLAFSTYQYSRIFFVGLNKEERVSVSHVEVGHCLGFAFSGPNLWTSAETRMFCYRDILADTPPSDAGREALYVPRLCYFTGNLDIHDVAVTKQGGVIFANTRFNCLATLSPTHSFRPLWKPHFISRLAGEDRCHLNGLTLVDGKAKYVSCISRSDVFEGWREHRESGGVIVDVTENKIVCEGLSMPHSPRWHNGKLWLLNSGTGELGHVDLDSGTFKPLCFLPGYARGLNFVNDRLAIVGLSKPRKDEAFSGLPLDGELKRREVAPRSGFCVIDLQTGDVLYWAKIEGKLVELYDVGVLHGVRSARAVSFASDEQRQAISIEETKGREGIV